MRRTLFLGLLLMLCPGCPKADAPKSGQGDGGHDAGHSHERGKMLIADAWKYHALLTAHLSREGNELDIFFETQSSKDPKPVAIPLESFAGHAQSSGGEKNDLKFECAPSNERPSGEKPGTCSHFVAKAPWMKPDDNLTVIVHVKLEGEAVRIEWKNFSPKKYAHHVE